MIWQPLDVYIWQGDIELEYRLKHNTEVFLWWMTELLRVQKEKIRQSSLFIFTEARQINWAWHQRGVNDVVELQIPPTLEATTNFICLQNNKLILKCDT